MTVIQEEVLLVAEGRLALCTGRARELREKARLSQVDCASVVEVEPATYCRWESGGRVPRDAAARRLAMFLRALETTISTAEGASAT